MRPFLLLALLGACAVHAQETGPSLGAPAQNWEMKIFTREGFRSMILRGSEARVFSETRYDVVDLNITTFTGLGDSKLDSVLLSPVASFFAKDNIASGAKSVRLIREDMEVTGEDWIYIHAQKKVSIQKNNRVVFHAALPDLLR